MCGILTCISRRGKKIDEGTLLRAANRMSHRGPDAQCHFVKDWIGMAHNRLSIIDLSSAANQPMFSHNGRYAIVYNGEIYNYKELRDELVDIGATFTTQSDTEVVLNAYIEFSSGCLNKLRGMFAFVIVDFYKNEVFAARDHLGIKPLHIYESGDYIIFSSEIKPLSEFVPLEPNYDVYFEQIVFRHVSGKNTLFKGVNKLLPGMFYVYRKAQNNVENHQYYKLSDTFYSNSKFKSRNEEDIIDEAGEILTESIKVHTHSDVGYNLELSGGLDSSLIAAILTKKLKCADLASYSISFVGNKCDESYYQNMVADKFRLKHHQIDMTGEIFSNILEEATYYMETPIVHLGCACLFYLTKYSALNSKVILTGEGADEIFGGYSWYNLMHDQHEWNSMDNIKKSIKKLFFLCSKDFFVSTHTSQWRWSEPRKVMAQKYFFNRNLSDRKSLLKDDSKNDVMNRTLYYDQMTYLPTLLTRQDKMSMANSVEARVPYCDRKVYEFINSIPASLKLNNGELKYVLKKIAEKHLPKELIYRRKNGLNIPLNTWFKDEKFLGRYLDMLLDDTTRKRGIYNHSYLRYLVKMQRDGKINVSKRLMSLIMFELWHRIFFDRQPAVSHAMDFVPSKIKLPQNA